MGGALFGRDRLRRGDEIRDVTHDTPRAARRSPALTAEPFVADEDADEGHSRSNGDRCGPRRYAHLFIAHGDDDPVAAQVSIGEEGHERGIRARGPQEFPEYPVALFIGEDPHPQVLAEGEELGEQFLGRELFGDGMRRYLRYYAEVFQLPRLTPAQIAARVIR